MPQSDRERLRTALAGAVSTLTGTRRLVAVEITAAGITTCAIHRGEDGTPRGGGWSASWPDLSMEQEMEHEWERTDSATAEQAVLRVTEVLSATDVFLIRSSEDGIRAERAFKWLRTARPDAITLRADVEMRTLLEEVIEDDPLCRPYELVVLKPDPGTGRLTLTSLPLFTNGARRGDHTEIMVRCVESDEVGTSFAVVTWDGLEPHPVSIRAGKVPPGRHMVKAVLERPGRVRFTSPGGLRKDPRDWGRLVASVPDRLAPAADPTHLICAVEVCGSAATLSTRLDRVRQIVTTLAARSGDRLRVSLIAYGAHSFDRRVQDPPLEVDWQVAPEHALDRLSVLDDRGPVTRGYPYHPHGAQVEDMLAEVERRLTPGGHTTLLTAGDRPAHPPRTDPSGLLPCPNRHDGETLVRALARVPGMTFGTIRAAPPQPFARDMWTQLGSSASAHLEDVDIRAFGARLGLAGPEVTPVSFPLIDDE